MQIEKLYYINEKIEFIEFSSNSIYHANISKVAGLSDIKNTLYTTASMGQDGDTVTGNKIQSRTITLSGAIKSTNKDSILEAKRFLSKVLNPHLTARLVYEYGETRRTINCRLETAPIFKRGNALLTFEIDVVCGYPFWQDEAETKTEIMGWQGGFEFSINKGGLEIPTATGIEMGTLTRDVVVVVLNEGDTAAGMRVEFTANGIVTNPRLTNVATAEYMAFNGLTLQAGDKLIVNTEWGNKGCFILRGETKINALSYWDIGGKFLQLETGENFFSYAADTNHERLDVAVYSTNQYLGV